VPTIAATDDRARPPPRSAGWCAYSAACVGVVRVDDRQAELGLQRAADVEATPLRLIEVRRALGRDHAVGAGRPGRVEADRDDRGRRQPGLCEHRVERLPQRVEGCRRPLEHPARRLAQVVDEEPAEAVEHRRVGRGAADVEADHNTRGDKGRRT
jgi:hypothetical protein